VQRMVTLSVTAAGAAPVYVHHHAESACRDALRARAEKTEGEFADYQEEAAAGWSMAIERAAKAEAENERLRAEVERLRGALTEIPSLRADHAALRAEVGMLRATIRALLTVGDTVWPGSDGYGRQQAAWWDVSDRAKALVSALASVRLRSEHDVVERHDAALAPREDGETAK